MNKKNTINSKKNKRKNQEIMKRISFKIKNLLYMLICVSIIAMVFIWIAKTYSSKAEKEQSKANITGIVNNKILDKVEEEDQIYVAKDDTLANVKCQITLESYTLFDELGKILPTLSEGYQNRDWNSLYEFLAMEKLKELSMTTDKEYFKEQETSLVESTGHETVVLMFHDLSNVGKYYICPVTIVGIIEETGTNILYDYDNAVEAVFTIYPNANEFTWLPFNIMFGRSTDEFSIIKDDEVKPLTTNEPTVSKEHEISLEDRRENKTSVNINVE